MAEIKERKLTGAEWHVAQETVAEVLTGKPSHPVTIQIGAWSKSIKQADEIFRALLQKGFVLRRQDGTQDSAGSPQRGDAAPGKSAGD